MKHYLWVLCAVTLTNTVVAQSTYKAAVVEYAPKLHAERFALRVLENVQEYVNFIGEAGDEAVDIIVFPENGLTGMDVNQDNIFEYSMELPDPKLMISPCDDQTSNFSKALIDLSCAAQSHKVYTVVNLVERRNQTGNVTYYNSNVVFNREGAVIARYSKMNLYKEAFVVPGNEMVTFKTDFGVTFGMLICADILYKKPALDIFKDFAIVDIIFPTAWFLQLPYYGALSVHHGYAVSQSVNLLVAGLDDPANHHGGSAIFLANGTIADSYISGAMTSKMLIAKVPIVTKQKVTEKCQVVRPSTPIDDNQESSHYSNWGTLPSISQFNTIQDDLSNYTFKSLNLNRRNISEMICIGKNKFCCFINMTANLTSTPNYSYKLAAFNGGIINGWITVGMRSCGLLACLNESTTSCGMRHRDHPRGVTFERIFLKWSIPDTHSALDQPSTITYNLKPLSNYTFCKDTLKDKTKEITISTENQSSLLTFAVFGRVYDYDHKGSGSFDSA